MKLRMIVVGVVLGLALAFAWPLVAPADAQLTQTYNPDKLRYRLIGDEPIATGDGRSGISGWRAAMLHDRQMNQCFMVVIITGQMSMSGPVPCPES